jgi:hypothetical protein
MRCLHCGGENRTGAKFCDECATPLPLACPSCGADNRPGAKFCNECATPLTRQAQVVSPKSQVEKEPNTGLQTLDSRPVSYTPRHLAERILFEREAMALRGAPDGERKPKRVSSKP